VATAAMPSRGGAAAAAKLGSSCRATSARVSVAPKLAASAFSSPLPPVARPIRAPPPPAAPPRGARRPAPLVGVVAQPRRAASGDGPLQGAQGRNGRAPRRGMFERVQQGCHGFERFVLQTAPSGGTFRVSLGWRTRRVRRRVYTPHASQLSTKEASWNEHDWKLLSRRVSPGLTFGMQWNLCSGSTFGSTCAQRYSQQRLTVEPPIPGWQSGRQCPARQTSPCPRSSVALHACGSCTVAKQTFPRVRHSSRSRDFRRHARSRRRRGRSPRAPPARGLGKRRACRAPSVAAGTACAGAAWPRSRSARVRSTPPRHPANRAAWRRSPAAGSDCRTACRPRVLLSRQARPADPSAP
jgi:hypothetical protein